MRQPKNDINRLKEDLNITRKKTETDLRKINRVLKEVDSSHFFLDEERETPK